MGVVQLKTNLRLFEAITIIVGSMIGSGILILPGAMLVKVASPWLVVLAWVAGAFFTAMGALTFAEMAAMFPRAGGQYHFLREGLGPFWSYLFGWGMFWIIMSGIIAGVAVAFANFLGFFVTLPGHKAQLGFLTLPAWGNAYVAIGLIWLLTGINYLGARFGGLISNVTVVGKYVGLSALVVLLFFVGQRHPQAFVSAIPDSATGLGIVAGFAGALALTLFAYDGWPQATFVASEIRNPKRNLPIALLVGPLVTALIYILLTLAYFWVVPAEQGVGIGGNPSSRIAIEAAKNAVGTGGASFIAVVALVSVFGTVNAYILTSPRIFYAMAQDGALLRSMGTLTKKGVPGKAMLYLAIWSSLLVMTGLYVQLVTMVVFGIWLFYVPTSIAHLRMRRTHAAAERPFRTPLYPLVPILFLLAALFVVATILSGAEWAYGLIALGAILAGIPFYLAQRRAAARDALATVQGPA
ncbi:MAG: amino acid permease [Halobacteriales archaeon]|nr:amino acid permease [Halobacteriales archaeon]